jgi:hypothetical protein
VLKGEQKFQWPLKNSQTTRQKQAPNSPYVI